MGISIRTALCAALLGGLGLLAAGPVAAGERPWTRPFADDGAAIVAEAAESTADRSSGAVLLLSERNWSFDAEGRLTTVTRTVWRYQDRAAVDADGGFRVTWDPWRHDRPEVRARVLQLGGRSFELDPASLVESGGGRSGEAVYDDRRALLGPVPNLSVGAVLETWVRVAEHRPVFEAGRVLQAGLWSSDELEEQFLEISAPEALPLRAVSRDLPEDASFAETVRDGRRVLRWHLPPGEVQEFEPNAPRGLTPGPVVEVTTAKSWRAVAKAYAAEVDAVLDGADLASIAQEATAGATDRRAIAEAALRWVVRSVRYTGLELGRQALVPVPPATTLERGFGDCKDQSTLLVGLLRARGLDAHVALLNVGTWHDVPEDLPGLGLFDHAIVHVGGRDPLWIDPTARHGTVDALPAAAQGRLALVASPKTRALVRTAVLPAERAEWWEETTFDLVDEGDSRAVHRFGGTGHLDLELREGYSGSSPDSEAVMEFASGWVSERFSGERVDRVQYPDPDDPSVPFVIEVEFSGTGHAVALGDGAIGVVAPDHLLTELGSSFVEDRSVERVPRRGPGALYRPHTTRLTRRFVFPPGYEVPELPPDLEGAVDPASWSIRFAREAPRDGREVVVAEARLRFAPEGRTELPAADYEALRSAMADLRFTPYPWIRGAPVAVRLVGQGRIEEALAELDRRIEARPEDPLPWIRRASTFSAAGLGDAAQEAARRATELAPDLARSWAALGSSLTLDPLARSFAGAWPRDEAIRAYRRALELKPDSPSLLQSLALCLEHDEYGERWSRAEDMEAALEVLRRIDFDEEPTAREQYWVDLFRLERYAELGALLRDAEGQTAQVLRVSVRAIQEGPEAAFAEAQRDAASLADVTALLAGSYADLVGAGKFAEAADLLEALAGGAPPPEAKEAIDLLRRVARGPEEPEPGSPEEVVGEYLSAILAGEEGHGRLQELLTAEAWARVADSGEIRIPGAESVRADAVGSGVPHRLVATIPLRLRQTVTLRPGEDVAAVSLRVGDTDEVEEGYVLVRRKRRWWIVGSGDLPGGLGDELLRRLDRRARDAAVFADAVTAAAQRSGAPMFRLVRSLWGDNGPATDEERRLLGELLACDAPGGCADGLRAVGRGSDQPVVVSALDGWLAEAGRLDEQAELRRAHRFGPDGLVPWPDASRVERELAAAAVYLAGGAADRALEIVRAAGVPETIELRTRRVGLLARLGETEEVDAESRELVGAATETGTLNDLAWFRLVVGLNDAVTLDAAQRAASGEGGRRRNVMHTLAAVHAEAGRAKEARRALEQGIAGSDDARLGPWDHYLIGRIAEIYGAERAARTSYGRIPAELLEDPEFRQLLDRRGFAADP